MSLQDNHAFSVLVTNFPVSRDNRRSTPEMLNDFFSQFGRIAAIRTTEKVSDPDTLEALVTFHDKSSAEKALEFNNSAVFERIIGVHSALDVDISHLANIPPATGLTEKIQEKVAAVKETVVHLGEKVGVNLPEVKETIGSYLASAYDTVASLVTAVHPQPATEGNQSS